MQKIQRWVKRLSNGDIKANVSSRRPRTTRTKIFIAKINRNLTQNTKKSQQHKWPKTTTDPEKQYRVL